MIYRVSWIKTIPSNRAAGIEHLQALAQTIKEDQQLDSSVFISDTVGPFNLIGLVVAYKNVAALYQNHQALDQAEKGHSKLIPSTSIFDWESPKWTTMRELKSGGKRFPNFLNVVSIRIRPGQIEAGREHMLQLAARYELTSQRPMGVLSNETGQYHQHHWTIGYDNLDDYEADYVKNATWSQLIHPLGNVLDLTTLQRDIGRFL